MLSLLICKTFNKMVTYNLKEVFQLRLNAGYVHNCYLILLIVMPKTVYHIIKGHFSSKTEKIQNVLSAGNHKHLNTPSVVSGSLSVLESTRACQSGCLHCKGSAGLLTKTHLSQPL